MSMLVAASRGRLWIAFAVVQATLACRSLAFAGEPLRWRALEHTEVAYRWTRAADAPAETLLVSRTAIPDLKTYVPRRLEVADVGLFLLLSVPGDGRSSARIAAKLGPRDPLGEVQLEGTERVRLGATGTATIEGVASFTWRGGMDVRTGSGSARFRSVFDASRGLLVEGEYAIDVGDGASRRTEGGILKLIDAPSADDVARAGRRGGGRPEAVTETALEPVEEPIQRGAAALLRTLGTCSGYDPEGTVSPYEVGEQAMLAFALLRSGVKPTEPRMAKVLAFLRDSARSSSEKIGTTYVASAALLALEAQRYERVPDPLGGIPSYRPGVLADEDAAAILSLCGRLLSIDDHGYWGYGGSPPFPQTRSKSGLPDVGSLRLGWRDQSNTQFAVYALDTATRAGVAVQREAFSSIARAHRLWMLRSGRLVKVDVGLEPLTATAEPEPAGRSGSGPSTEPRATPVGTIARAREMHGEPHPIAIWPYCEDDDSHSLLDKPKLRRNRLALRVSPSMDFAGLSCLAIGLVETGAPLAGDPDIESGLAGAQVDLASVVRSWKPLRRLDPTPESPDGYLLFSIEKAMEVLGIQRLGGIDWYAEGVRALLPSQDAEGLFSGRRLETAFALLFLNRATLAPPRLHLAKRSGRIETLGERRPPRRGEVELDGQMVEPVGLVRGLEADLTGLPLARRAIFALPETDRPIVLSAVADVLERTRSKKVREAVRAIAREVAGADLRPKAIRELFLRWQEATVAGDGCRWDAIPRLRVLLKDEAVPVRYAAALALSRVDALEAVPDLLLALERAQTLEARRFLAGCVAGLLGADFAYDAGASPEAQKAALDAARAAFEKEGAERVRAAELRRCVASLSGADEGLASRARALLKERGREALPALVQGLANPAGSTGPILSLLREITGKDFGPDVEAWRRYVDERRRGTGEQGNGDGE